MPLQAGVSYASAALDAGPQAEAAPRAPRDEPRVATPEESLLPAVELESTLAPMLGAP